MTAIWRKIGRNNNLKQPCRLRTSLTGSIAAIVATITIGAMTPANAQGTDIRGGLRPPNTPSQLPEADLQPLPEPVFELPPVAPSPADRVGGGAYLMLQSVEIEGNTALDDETLQMIASAYVGRAVTIEELFRLRDALTLAYVNAGFVNSGAVLPDQDVSAGIVRFTIVEGSLEDIRITGTKSFDPDYLVQRIEPGASVPLNVNELQERLQLLILNPTVSRLDARLGPGSATGKAFLDIEVEETRPYNFDFTIANNQSTSVGANNATIGATLRNLLGRNDRMRLTAGATQGLREAALDYTVPIIPNRLSAYIRGDLSRSELITDDIKDLEIESETESVTIGFIMPLIESTSNRLELDLGFVREHNKTSLLGEPFSFSPGAEDGETDLSLIRFAQRWQNRARDRAISFGSTFTLGLEILGASENDGNEPDGEFLAWLGQIEVAQRLFSDNDQLVFRGELQLTEDPLLASEQFAAGGLDSVRGYRVNEIVRDNGWTASLEYRLPVLDFLLPERPINEETRLELVPFIDAGGAFKHPGRDGPADADTLIAPGLGLRYTLPSWLVAELYWGIPLTGQNGATNDALQEHGVSFRLRLAY